MDTERAYLQLRAGFLHDHRIKVLDLVARVHDGQVLDVDADPEPYLAMLARYWDELAAEHADLERRGAPECVARITAWWFALEGPQVVEALRPAGR